MKMKEESEKVGLNLNIQETKIMASSSITSWEIDGGTVETVADFIFLGSRITDSSHEIKRCLLLGRKVMTKLDSILKGRGTRDQIASICWIIEKESSRKISISALLIMPKPLTVWITTNYGTFSKRWKYQTTLPVS